jgi:hypothetical protein
MAFTTMVGHFASAPLRSTPADGSTFLKEPAFNKTWNKNKCEQKEKVDNTNQYVYIYTH